jgi:hypothetical protein
LNIISNLTINVQPTPTLLSSIAREDIILQGARGKDQQQCRQSDQQITASDFHDFVVRLLIAVADRMVTLLD